MGLLLLLFMVVVVSLESKRGVTPSSINYRNEIYFIND